MKKIIFLFLFFALWINSAFSDFYYNWKFYYQNFENWKSFIYEKETKNKVFTFNDWNIFPLYYDYWLNSYYFQVNWTYFLFDKNNFTYKSIWYHTPSDPSWYVYNWKLIIDWFNSSKWSYNPKSSIINWKYFYLSKNKNIVTLNFDWKNFNFKNDKSTFYKLVTVKNIINNKQYVLWIKNNENYKYTAFLYSPLEEKEQDIWEEFSIPSSCTSYNIMYDYHDTYTIDLCWTIITWSVLNLKPWESNNNTKPCLPPYAPWECYNDPNYTNPRDPNWPQGPITPNWELPKWLTSYYNSNVWDKCEMFVNWKFQYSLWKRYIISQDIPNFDTSQYWFMQKILIWTLNILIDVTNFLWNSFETLFNNFLTLFWNFWYIPEWKYCYFWHVQELKYQQYLFIDVDNSNPVRRLLPIDSHFKKWEPNIIDYLFLFIFWISIFYLFYYIIKK